MKKDKLLLSALGLVWLVGVGVGMNLLWGYASSPGETAMPPDRWPVECRIQPAPDRPTLVMLAHPRCPCTRASIRELALVMTACNGKLTAFVAFHRPANVSEDWAKTDLWTAALEIPGVSVLSDDGGELARSFNAATSGQVALYDSQGTLLFSGGITAARGHSGDNPGRSAIIALVTGTGFSKPATSVFGCDLFDQHSECSEGAVQCTR